MQSNTSLKQYLQMHLMLREAQRFHRDYPQSTRGYDAASASFSGMCVVTCLKRYALEIREVRCFALIILLISTFTISGAQTPIMGRLAEGFHCSEGKDSIEVTAFSTNILRVAVRPEGTRDDRSEVMNPGLRETPAKGLRLEAKGGHIKTDAFEASLNCSAHSLSISDSAGSALISVQDLLGNASKGMVEVHRAVQEPMYGMAGTDRNVPVSSIERPEGAVVRAGTQGNGGAPFFFTKSFGFLVDSVDGVFTTQGTVVTFSKDSRKEIEFFVLVGKPLQTMSSLADLTGHAPMPPRWTLGFLNSQYGIDEPEMKTLTAHYRASHIPMDGWILDFDWKAWGEDNYGEWRWNSTSGPGNKEPDKFPDGASGALGKEMLAQGVHIAGILKPRILLYKPNSTELMEAAAYAEKNNFWYPGGGEQRDYRSKQASKNLNFMLPAERDWFWKHLEPAFDAGMTAWWPDEADEGELANGKKGLLSSLEFFDMGRALYDGQRGYSNTRVWSLNRNYYLGSARYGYAEWSGDIRTGAASMALQPIRMIGTLNLGEPHWSMDTGGFIGHPTDEEYARWIEFAAFVPIFRVHGGHNEKRQPWVYGPIAEAAATKAMRLRYALMPYIYSAERTCFETGIGMARPLEWVFPDDAQSAAQTDEWMFGDALLVAPVLDLKADTRKVYLPAGTWREYATGKAWSGSQTIAVPTDGKNWSDIPLFVRDGSIVATEVPGDDTDAMKPKEIVLDVFASKEDAAIWTMYDDDGASYAYEKGAYFKQAIRAGWAKGSFSVDLLAPEGTFATTVTSYDVRLHGVTVGALRWHGREISESATLVDEAGEAPAWKAGKDRFGDMTEVRIKAGRQDHLDLHGPETNGK
jgi:alpha-glucosidase